MEIIKKETVRFSDIEQRSIEMTILLLQNLADNATSPRLVEIASGIADDLGDFMLEYEEKE
jgi:hypothetical protein